MKRRWLAASLALGVWFGGAANGQSNEEVRALKKDVEALKRGQRAIEKEINDIKKLLLQERPGQRQDVTLSVEGSPFMGDKNAKVTLIEFTDYQCPFCAAYFRQTLPQIVTEYVKTGKVKYVPLNFPLGMHPDARKAAEAALCAGDQGQFWGMRDRLMNHQKALGSKDLPAHAQALGLNATAFRQCLDSGKYAGRVSQELAEGQKAGVAGTPSFFLGLTSKADSNVRAEKTLVGAQPFPSFKEAIDSLLSQK